MPAQRPRVAVDLSSNLLRVVEGTFGGPIRCGSGAAPAGSIVGGKIKDASALAAALQQLLARTEVRETRALVAVSDAVATFRILKLPPSTTDHAIDSVLTKEFPLDPERMDMRWIDVGSGDKLRTIYATAWDRELVDRARQTVKDAGLEATVVELKSICVARTVPDASCVVLDMSTNPAEVFLVADHLPQLWHSFEITVQLGEDITGALVGPLQKVIRFFERRRDAAFGPYSPIVVAGDQVLPSHLLAALTQALGHPVQQLVPPPRTPSDLRHGTYLTCLGLLMRRAS